ncbi:response regulator transcription factor [Campylobacter sp. 9BO]|uniref:response regulator transcription factor n=1 Tax=Campylobacter sp. 9BO TaxID=3424759 RepID=UPI003D327007
MQADTLKLLSNTSVLIVEDDTMARTLIQNALKPYCKAVFVAGDGYEGVDSFSKNTPDVILTDIHMPMMNGFEMMKNILAIKPHQKFIVFTSFDTDNNLLKSIEAGAAMFLKKPIDMQVLRSMLLTLSAKNEEKLIKIDENLSINLQKERIFKNGNEVYLTFLQNKLFWLFAYNLNKLVSYEMISEYVYENEPVSKSAIQNVILRLKKELGIKIKNISEAGYMLTSVE